MTYRDRKEYMKAWRQAHREEIKAYNKAYNKDYRNAHKEEMKAYNKAYYQAHKEERNACHKAWRQEHRDENNAYQKAYYQAHKEEMKAYHRSYQNSDTNSQGHTKESIRRKSRRYLFNTLSHTKVEGYEIHHCFGYDDFKHFIYIPKELHLEIHQFLRDNEIDADSDHYNKIEHLIVNYLKCNDRHVLIMNNKEV